MRIMTIARNSVALISWPIICLAFVGAETASVETLTAQLNDKDPARAALAADTLGGLKEKTSPAIAALVKALGDTRRVGYSPGPVHQVVCSNAADALVNIGEPTVPALLTALEKEKDSGVRYRIFQSLGRIGRPAAKAIPPLKAIVAGDAPESDRFYAFDALGKIHSPGPELVAFASSQLNDKSPGMRSLAIGILGKSGKDAVPSIDQLIRLLADPDNRAVAISADFVSQRAVRTDAADALGRIGPPATAAAPRLTKMMADDKDAVPRAAAAIALIRIDEKNSSAAFDTLQEMLVDKSAKTDEISAAANALAGLGLQAKRALPALAKLLHHQDEYVRMDALDAIAEIGGKDAIPLLEFSIRDEEEHIRERAQEAIDELKGVSKQ